MAGDSAVGEADRTTAQEVTGLDALELGGSAEESRMATFWSATWPKLAAIVLALVLWELVVRSGWKPPYALAPPAEVFSDLAGYVVEPGFWQTVATTLRRAAVGFLAATAIGLVVGLATARFRLLRAAIGSLITGLQTMPSIAWFPLALLLFGFSEAAMYFVVILGAAPSIANGVIGGVDYVPPLLRRVGRNLGASSFQLYRHVILPASLPNIVGGLKQGWAFAWRSLMAGELLVPLGSSIGFALDFAGQRNDASAVIAWMVVILIIGILVDVLFGRADSVLRRRWGLADANA